MLLECWNLDEVGSATGHRSTINLEAELNRSRFGGRLVRLHRRHVHTGSVTQFMLNGRGVVER